jgi:hypothetical protein
MAKTTLTVDIEYDPELTDPEGLASAMDRLLETALSTPGVMAEYGDSQVGEFLVAAADDSRHGSCAKDRRPSYTLQVNGPLLRKQRQALLDVIRLKLAEETYEALDGLLDLMDEIADQAHDQYGIDCLLDEQAPSP